MANTSNNQVNKIRKIESAINRNLFLVSAVITVVAMVAGVIGFFSRGDFPPSGMNIFYIGILLLYSLHKELLRWMGGQENVERQGELFVYAWIGITVALYTVNFFSKDYFSYSQTGVAVETLREFSFITLEVSIIFLLTRLSKFMRVVFFGKKSMR